MKLAISVKGARGLSEKMNRVAEGLRGEILLTAAQTGAIAVEGSAKSLVARRSGQTARSIRREVVKSEANIAVVKVTAGGPGVHGGRPVPFFLEFGTRKTRAQPFMRPAVRKNRGVVGRYIRGTIGGLLRSKAGL